MTWISLAGRELPIPDRTPESTPYWDGAERGELWLRCCAACGKHHHYPRSVCPFCFAPRPTWVRSAGRGVVYSYSVIDRAPVPYVIAWVTLDEGPSMLSNLIDCDTALLAIGLRVRLAAPPSSGGPSIPMFTPDA